MCHVHGLKPTHKNKIWHNGRVHAGIQTKLSQNDTLVWHMHEFEPNYTVFKYMSGLCTESKQKTISKYEYGIISKSVYVYHENVHKYDLCFVLFAISLKLYNPPVFVMYIFSFGLKAALA